MRRRFSALLFCLGSFLTAAPWAFAGGIEVTDVSLEGQTASVTFNGAVQVRDIRWQKRNGRVVLRFPEYVSPNGRKFPQVMVHSREAQDAVGRAILNGAAGPEKPGPLAFAVSDPSFLRSPSRRANVQVTLNGEISFVLGVMETRSAKGESLWVAYPSRPPRKGVRPSPQVIVLDRSLRESIEATVLRKFRRSVSEQADLKPHNP